MAASGGNWKNGRFISAARATANRTALKRELQGKIEETRNQLRTGKLTPTLRVSAGHRRLMKMNIERWESQIKDLG